MLGYSFLPSSSSSLSSFVNDRCSICLCKNEFSFYHNFFSFLEMNEATKKCRDRKDRYFKKKYWNNATRYRYFMSSQRKGKLRIGIHYNDFQNLYLLTEGEWQSSFELRHIVWCHIGRATYERLAYPQVYKNIRWRGFSSKLSGYEQFKKHYITTSCVTTDELDLASKWASVLKKEVRKNFIGIYLGIPRLPIPDELVAEIRSYM
jgi:hypothetical protein